MTNKINIPGESCAIHVLRFMGNGSTRAYEIVEFTGDKACNQIDVLFRRLKCFGCLSNLKTSYGLIDVLNGNMDIVETVPLNKYGVNWIIKNLNLRVTR